MRKRILFTVIILIISIIVGVLHYHFIGHIWWSIYTATTTGSAIFTILLALMLTVDHVDSFFNHED